MTLNMEYPRICDKNTYVQEYQGNVPRDSTASPTSASSPWLSPSTLPTSSPSPSVSLFRSTFHLYDLLDSLLIVDIVDDNNKQTKLQQHPPLTQSLQPSSNHSITKNQHKDVVKYSSTFAHDDPPFCDNVVSLTGNHYNDHGSPVEETRSTTASTPPLLMTLKRRRALTATSDDESIPFHKVARTESTNSCAGTVTNMTNSSCGSFYSCSASMSPCPTDLPVLTTSITTPSALKGLTLKTQKNERNNHDVEEYGDDTESNMMTNEKTLDKNNVRRSDNKSHYLPPRLPNAIISLVAVVKKQVGCMMVKNTST